MSFLLSQIKAAKWNTKPSELFCGSLQIVYVSGRNRPKGEMNGKSGNMNNCCQQIYPPGTTHIPNDELVSNL